MRWIRALGVWLALSSSVPAATLGTVFSLTGGASDIVLDETRARLYLVRPSPYNQIDVYSIPQRRILNSIRTDAFPLAAALSLDGNVLYVTCHDGSSLNIIDVNTLAVTGRVSLPARPEGVAVGGDGRVLITTIGAGAGNLLNTLLLFDPAATGGVSLATVPVTTPPPMPPQLPPPAGRVFLTNRSQLIATPDRTKIIGVNAPNQNTRVVFVFESASGTVLRSRIVGDLSTVLSVSPDGSRFMLGLRLFESDTLTVLAQENAANAPFPLNTNIAAQGFNQVAQQFNLQQNQGGSVFSPDGGTVYTSFNIAPVQNPAPRPNLSQLLLGDPDNLLIRMGLQLPENLAGKMVITSDGGVIHALSESGFVSIPVGQISQNPIAEPESAVALLGNDQCGVAPDSRRARITIRNDGRGQLQTLPPTLVQSLGLLQGPAGLGGAGGPGGGGPGQGVVIILPPVPGAGQPGQLPAGVNPQQAQIVQTSPQTRVQQSPDGGALEFVFNAFAGRSPGTVAPHDFILNAPTAINVPRSIRIYQNQHDPESRAEVIPVEVGVSPNEGLVDIVADNIRRKVYISNSGLNRVEVFDMGAKQFQRPIKVGQLPRSMALSPDGGTLYVANSGGESISVIDLDKQEVSGRIKFPPIPFNGNLAVITPSVIAAGQRGLQIVMSNGTLWRVIGDEAVPRPVSAQIGAAVVPAPRTMVATPNGEFILLLDGNGNAYLYDALVDDFVVRRQVITPPITGFYGPVAAGPRGQYFVVNGTVLNQSLSPIAGTGVGNTPPRPGATPVTTRPIAAVAAASGTTYARFSQPIRANQNALPADYPLIEIVDAGSGATMRSAPVLEGPLSTVVGNQRVNISGAGMTLDAAGNTVYALTTSGLSVVNMEPVNQQDRPVVSQNGTVNLASYRTEIAQAGLISIFGRNLGSDAVAPAPLPAILGGVCVTLDNTPLPLVMTSPGQLNAQIPPETAIGRRQLIVRAIDRKLASNPQIVTIARYAPAVFADEQTGEAAIFHHDGRRVNQRAPAKRDERLVMYATGLGVTRGTRPPAGSPAVDGTALTDPVKVFFGDSRYREAEIIVEWSGLAPGFVGVYQINLYVPGAHLRGDRLPVTLRVGTVNSSLDGPLLPVIAVD